MDFKDDEVCRCGHTGKDHRSVSTRSGVPTPSPCFWHTAHGEERCDCPAFTRASN